ncbi:MAG: tRNA uridine-5-carboxymethylaminomethyl(34) synthesis GTPase MnmE [bacterium]|jgi:tRNA modification GTPase trmE|nr:tRNA uridine-5-carboxymethylaminomethyl(34) synthesis GTPase MnmE [bacterium]
MISYENDTIAAIATKLGVGAISIIRVSGIDAIPLVNKIFKGKDLEKVKSHTIHYGYIVKDEEKIDEVLVTVMRAPKTFTREDVVEINCHGGINTTLTVFSLLQELGIKAADRGEFTKRAFLNGRIDLTEAEAVMDLIESKSDEQRKLAMNSLGGSLKQYINSFREPLKKLIANIEVNIDYPEYYDIEEVTKKDIATEVEKLIPKLKRTIEESKSHQVVRNGIKTVIVGRPNVGKSSILNTLINQNKAIVTDIEGTTRDIVEGTVFINGVELLLIDTAGIRETNNVVEQLGVKKSLELLGEADLVLAVFNVNENLSTEDKEIIEKLDKDKTIIVLNKDDLPRKLKNNDFSFSHIVYTNTNFLEGVNSLKQEIVKMFSLDKLEETEAFLSNNRQLNCATKALDILVKISSNLEKDIPLDLIEIDLREVLTELGTITGEVYDEELLDTLFENFCVGK